MSAASKSPLFRFNRERNDLIDQVVDRVTREALERAWESPADGLDYLLNEAAYVELARLAHVGPQQRADHDFWRSIARSLGRSTEEENAEHLRTIVARFAHETVGHFRPSVFKLATEIVPPSLGLFVGKRSKGLLPEAAAVDTLRESLRVEGEVGKLKRLAEVGTLVFVPTHSSHLDAALVSWAIHRAGLPPVVYGAARNLFSQPLMAFFMANLGAYKVDRRRRFRLYRRVLKAYSQVLLERGYHSLFFPGGMRSRGNDVERKLRLGLLSTALEAYGRNVISNRSAPNVYVVPVVLGYSHVLEAETLIDDYLADESSRRPIIDADEFGDVRRIRAFARAALDSPSPITVRFCTPMDVFGNAVDQDGASVDAMGRCVDPRKYLWVDGAPRFDRARDRAYTRQLAGRITDAYRRNNVIHPLHVVSFALLEHVRRQHPTWDVARVVHFARGDRMQRAVAEGETERVLRLLKRDHDAGNLRLARRVRALSASALLDEALAHYGSYHTDPVVAQEAGWLRLLDLRLVYFYANRLRGYDLVRRLRSTPGGY